ncbi:hypothetical protein [Gordonia sp. UCD-TK1]|uniref:DUF7572 family protein n=1 Tax=Gordonia sp. UCD-TK1 TaxID=1857893 RepID=UPI0011120E92|nr:hypothetical protein [Gordonia sp. UCD-TK1]
MKTAQLVMEAVPHKPPITNLYRTDDGHLLVMVLSPPNMAAVMTRIGLFPVTASHIPKTVSVFLADERGEAVDYDGDPANGMTPILSTDSRSFAMTIVPELVDSESPYVDALAALGYTLTETETS